VRSSNANGVSADYSYDNLSRLSTVFDNRQPSGSQATTYSYDDVGNLTNVSAPNGVTTAYAYNSLNRLTSLAVSKGGSTVAGYAYTLGAAGNRLSVTEANGRAVSYGYDSLYRLTSETITSDPAAVNGAISYGYDAVGNRLARTSSVAGVPNQAGAVDANDRLTGDAYDANGNTVASGGSGYVYDFENRLVAVNAGNPNEIRIVYDGDGNRVAKTVGGVTTKYLVDANNPTGYAQVVEESQGGQVVRQYTYGYDLISQRQLISGNWQTSFYQYDGHGSVRGLTDASGALTDTFTYDAFGVLIARTGTTPNHYLYAGEQFDPDLGLYYNRARYLNTGTGRFWSQDSYEGQQFEPATLHKYIYAGNNPPNEIDPSGNYSISEQNLTLAVVGTLLTIATINFFAQTRPKADPSPVPVPIPAPNPSPSPSPSPSPIPTPHPIPPVRRNPEDNFVNLDTGTATAFSMVGYTDLATLKAAIGGRVMLMCATAAQEFQMGVNNRAGVLERVRAAVFLASVVKIPDTPDPQIMAVSDPNGTRGNDKIIFGTGQAWNIQTFTGDGRFVRHAKSNGVVFRPRDPYIHPPATFTGR
jgi:RHS repeat-associated protein